jgi:hypothetical protein
MAESVSTSTLETSIQSAAAAAADGVVVVSEMYVYSDTETQVAQF